MDVTDPRREYENNSDGEIARPRALPDDLPKSLDDRRTVPSYGGETEMYDAWQGTGSSVVGAFGNSYDGRADQY